MKSVSTPPPLDWLLYNWFTHQNHCCFNYFWEYSSLIPHILFFGFFAPLFGFMYLFIGCTCSSLLKQCLNQYNTLHPANHQCTWVWESKITEITSPTCFGGGSTWRFVRWHVSNDKPWQFQYIEISVRSWSQDPISLLWVTELYPRRLECSPPHSFIRAHLLNLKKGIASQQSRLKINVVNQISL